MNLDDFILKKDVIINKNIDNPIHLALCFDKSYALPSGVFLTSILENNKDKNISVHLFVLSIDDKDIKRFKLLANYNINLSLYYINNLFETNSNMLIASHITAATYLRFIVPDILKNEASKLLYLDCDMLCNSSINKIVEIDISNNIAAVVADLYETQINQEKKYLLPKQTYFNAGLLYINTDLWCENRISEKAIEMLNSGIKYDYADQDILNILLSGKTVFLPKECNNFQDNPLKALLKTDFNISNEIKNTIIFHFTGKYKPWYQVYLIDIYEYYINISPWKNVDISFCNEKNLSVFRKYSKRLMKEKKILLSIKYRLLYILNKIGVIHSL